VLGNFLLRYFFLTWHALHPRMFVPATLSIALAMGCAILSTRSPRPTFVFLIGGVGSLILITLFMYFFNIVFV
jgi:hypothetical protein